MKVVLIGANNPETIRMINAVARATLNFEVIGFLDNDANKIGKDFFGYKVMSGTTLIDNKLINNCFFVNLITRDMRTRFEVSKEVLDQNGIFCNFIHPSINLEMVELGSGNYIQDSVVIQAGVKIGCNSSIHIGAMIGHETYIGNSSFIAHGCNLSGFTYVDDGVFLGAGVTTIPRVKIGKWSVVGAGSVVTKDIPDFSIAVGNPARIIKQVESNHFDCSIFKFRK